MDNFYVGGKEDLPIEANWWVYKHPSRSWRKTEVVLYTLRFFNFKSKIENDKSKIKKEGNHQLTKWIQRKNAIK